MLQVIPTVTYVNFLEDFMMTLSRHVAAAGLAALSATSAIAGQPVKPWSASTVDQELRSLVAVARSADGSEVAVGNWGDGTVRRYRKGEGR